MKRAILALLAIVSVAAIAAGVYWFRWRPIEVDVAAFEHDVEVRLFGIGTVEAQVSAKVGFQVAGRIVTLAVDQGDVIEEGALLARLDRTMQETRVRKAHVALEQARTALGRAKALQARAEVNQRQKSAISQRRLALVDRGAVSREAADDALAAAEIAAADLAVARIDVEVARAAEGDAAANLAIESTLLDQHDLRAPFRTRVIARSKEIGAIVAPGEAVLTILEPSTIWVRGFFDEAQAGGLAIGQTAHVRLRSEPHVSVAASVVRIDAENDRVTEERRLYVRCNTCRPEHLLRYLGEQAEIEIVKAVVPAGRFVPAYAIEGYDGRSGVVWTIENGVLSRKALAFGERLLDGRVRVVSGAPDETPIVIARERGEFREGRPATMRRVAQ